LYITQQRKPSTATRVGHSWFTASVFDFALKTSITKL